MATIKKITTHVASPVSKPLLHRGCVSIPLTVLTGAGLEGARMCDVPRLLFTPPLAFTVPLVGLAYSHGTDALLLYFVHPLLPELEPGMECVRLDIGEARERWPFLFAEEGPFANPRYLDY